MNSKTVFATIVGRTNAGKSSLLNAVIGEKIAAVSSKSQTTRTRITGVKTMGEMQLVFMDTPGLHKPLNKLSDHMLKAVKESVADVDVILFMIDASKPMTDREKEMLEGFQRQKVNLILIFNKIDLVTDKTALAQQLLECDQLYHPAALIPCSVLQNKGVDTIIEETLKFAVESPHFFPDDTLTDQPERILAAEMVREQVLRNLDHEVPHGIAVLVESMSERETTSGEDILDLSVTIFCERDSHKGIVIGKNGSMLKKISSGARASLEQFFRIKVNLQCWVKVKEDWRNRESLIRSFGLVEDK